MNNKPKCFGIIDRVFPLNEDGIRETPKSCINTCPLKKECIVAAIENDSGMEKQNEMLDAAYESGNMNFFSRWARKKTLHNKKDEKRKISIFKRSKK